ncbi:hypothetical protein MIT9_P2035 [Methylomarinovum caldicuralii]|uniref:Putative restriction endonuclease domain-containing protein n=1 Tax=Methylomarinovum caldicuralii TaxID=438856 RepID=A0AAU9C5P9_9GAMM|nr:Uma2 family endonuclease [Methylomarinovum caldicuralii]BCX82449.1 hypothetical protein MIT9_P2035 [Methylomarinovum caldicuralii]
MSVRAESLRLTPQAYLEGEKTAPVKHEYLQGQVYAMVGAADGHVRLTMNFGFLLQSHLRGTPCSTYISDMKVRIDAGEAFFYPDVLVTCDVEDRRRVYFKDHPLLVIEVLSPTTEGFDRGEKFAWYRRLASLREYVLADPRRYAVDVFRRNDQGRWELFSFAGEDARLELASVDFSCALAAVYEGVDFSLATGDADAPV